MADKNPADDQRRAQHPVKYVDNPPVPTTAQALANSKKQVDSTAK